MNSSTTPPPPARVHTPPTPLHGAKYDTYEPYSPRRSSRLNAKREQSPMLGGSKTQPKAQLSQHRTSPKPIKVNRTSSTPSNRPAIKRTSSQHISPPSSPLSPSQAPTSSRAKQQSRSNANVARSSGIRRDKSPPETDSDLDMSHWHARPGDQVHGSTRPALEAMLPTPVKTPRKRQLHDSSRFKSTARALFPSLPATIDEAMPSPRRARKARPVGFTMDALDEDGAQGNGKIQIYTDSKERIPDEDGDDGDENPFISRQGARRSKAAATTSTRRQKTKHGMTKEIDEAVERGEGMVYVFRGKKMFRRFEDTHNGQKNAAGENGDIEAISSDIELRKRAGESASVPLPRSSLQPRLLFPPKDPTPSDVDEEAVTDIEAQQDLEDQAVITPVKQSFYPATPPATGRKRKGPSNSIYVDGDVDATEANGDPSGDLPMGLDGATDYLQPPKATIGKHKTSPFDTWQRTKAVTPTLGSASPDEPKTTKATSTIKRRGETLEKTGNVEKRSRSGQI